MTEEDQKQMSVVLAFTIDVFATFLTQCSYLLMKQAHVDNDSNQEKSAFTNMKMYIGLFLIIFGGIIHILMMPFCPLVLLATNSALAILISALLAVYFLNEKLAWAYDCSAFALISGGTIAMVMLSKETERQLTTEIIQSQLSSLQTILFGVVYLALVIVSYVVNSWFNGQIKLFEKQGELWAKQASEGVYTPSTSTVTPVTADYTNTISGDTNSQVTAGFSSYVTMDNGNINDNFMAVNHRESPIGSVVSRNQDTDQVRQSDQMKDRPFSTLILTIQNTSNEQIREIAPGTSKQLKRLIKVPMVTILTMAGLQAGITACFFKWFGEIFTSSSFKDFEANDLWVMTVCLVIAVASALMQFTYLNQAMARYAQVEVISIYQVTIMIFTIVSGLLLMDEAQAYTKAGLLTVFGCAMFMVLGIQVLTCKTNHLATVDSSQAVAEEISSSQDKKESLLHDENYDKHTKYLYKLFSEQTEAQ